MITAGSQAWLNCKSSQHQQRTDFFWKLPHNLQNILLLSPASTALLTSICYWPWIYLLIWVDNTNSSICLTSIELSVFRRPCQPTDPSSNFCSGNPLTYNISISHPWVLLWYKYYGDTCSRTSLEWNSAINLSYVQGSVLLHPSSSSKSRMITGHIFLTCFHFALGIQ